MVVAPTAAIAEPLVVDSPFVIDSHASAATAVADPIEPEVSAGPAVAVIDPPSVTPPPVKRKRRKGPIVLVLLLLLAAVVGYFGWQFGTMDTVSTPKLTGLTRSEALAKLESMGLTMQVSDEQYSERREAGTIISSDPGAGQRVAANGTVSVVLSKGPERYRVPNVKGMSQDDASQLLSDNNLETGQILQDYSRKWPQGQIMRTDPAVGTPLKRGTAVSLTVSMGPEPVVVPSVTNQTVEQAQAALSAAGFRVKTTEQYDDSVALGRVISSNPSGGTTAYRGDTVRLVVSKGSEYISVPGVVGMDTESAKATLEQAGFKVETHEQFGVTLANRVISQDPDGGTQAVRGTTVTLTIT